VFSPIVVGLQISDHSSSFPFESHIVIQARCPLQCTEAFSGQFEHTHMHYTNTTHKPDTHTHTHMHTHTHTHYTRTHILHTNHTHVHIHTFLFPLPGYKLLINCLQHFLGSTDTNNFFRTPHGLGLMVLP